MSNNIVPGTLINKVKIYFIYLSRALTGTLHEDVRILKEAAIEIQAENEKLKKQVARKTATATVSVAKKTPSKKAPKDSGSK